MNDRTALWVGAYPTAGAGTETGRGEGLWRVDAAAFAVPGEASRDAVVPAAAVRQVAVVPAASFVAAHPRRARLYAVSEVHPGLLTVLEPAEATGNLRVGLTHRTGGAFPCHVLVPPSGDMVVVSHYGDGMVSVFAVTDAGDPTGAPLLLPPGGTLGPRADRQDGPHAHSSVVSPDGRTLLVADLGTDELRRYRLRPGAAPQPDAPIRLPAGSGPRHMAFARLSDGTLRLLVTLELSAELAELDWDPERGTGALRSVVGLRGPGSPAALPSHVVVTGGRVLVGVRGPDVLMTLRLRSDAPPALVGETPTVAWPRHFAQVGEHVVVAGEKAGELGVHPLGRPDEPVRGLVDRVALPAPACVVDAAGWRS